MMILPLFVLLVAPWAITLASSFGGLINYLLGFAIVVMVVHLIALATVTILRAQHRKHAV